MTNPVDPERNIHAPPQARVADTAPVASGPEFYVISQGKFLPLYLTIAGIYGDDGFCPHWKAHKRRHAAPIWPIARGFFSIFFAHRLAVRIIDSLRRWDRGVSPLGAMATLCVVSEVVLRIRSRLAAGTIGWPYAGLFTALMLLPVGLSLLRMQRATNHLRIAPDLLFWALILFSITLSPEEMASA